MDPELIGLGGALLTTVSFAPQAIKVIRTNDTAAISLAMYTLFVTGVTLWLVYGLLIGNRPMILGNAVTLILAATIFIQKIRHVFVTARRRAP